MKPPFENPRSATANHSSSPSLIANSGYRLNDSLSREYCIQISTRLNVLAQSGSQAILFWLLKMECQYQQTRTGKYGLNITDTKALWMTASWW